MSIHLEVGVDDSLPDDIIKFTYPDGSEQVISLQSGRPERVIEATEE